MNTVLNLLSAAAVVVAGAYAAATSASDAWAVQSGVQTAAYSQPYTGVVNQASAEPAWAQSPFVATQDEARTSAPNGEVLRGAQWQTVSDDVETAHAPKAENQRWVF